MLLGGATVCVVGGTQGEHVFRRDRQGDTAVREAERDPGIDAECRVPNEGCKQGSFLFGEPAFRY